MRQRRWGKGKGTRNLVCIFWRCISSAKEHSLSSSGGTGSSHRVREERRRVVLPLLSRGGPQVLYIIANVLSSSVGPGSTPSHRGQRAFAPVLQKNSSRVRVFHSGTLHKKRVLRIKQGGEPEAHAPLLRRRPGHASSRRRDLSREFNKRERGCHALNRFLAAAAAAPSGGGVGVCPKQCVCVPSRVSVC